MLYCNTNTKQQCRPFSIANTHTHTRLLKQDNNAGEAALTRHPLQSSRASDGRFSRTLARHASRGGSGNGRRDRAGSRKATSSSSSSARGSQAKQEGKTKSGRGGGSRDVGGTLYGADGGGSTTMQGSQQAADEVPASALSVEEVDDAEAREATEHGEAEQEDRAGNGEVTAVNGVGNGNGSGSGGRGRRPPGSEDAYMLIYVRRGVGWGPGSCGEDERLLPDRVLVSVLCEDEDGRLVPGAKERPAHARACVCWFLVRLLLRRFVCLLLRVLCVVPFKADACSTARRCGNARGETFLLLCKHCLGAPLLLYCLVMTSRKRLAVSLCAAAMALAVFKNENTSPCEYIIGIADSCNPCGEYVEVLVFLRVACPLAGRRRSFQRVLGARGCRVRGRETSLGGTDANSARALLLAVWAAPQAVAPWPEGWVLVFGFPRWLAAFVL